MAHQDGAASAASDAGEAEPNPLHYRIAMVRSLEHGFTSIHGHHQGDYRYGNDIALIGYVRVSDIIEVEFPPLSNDVVIAGAVQALDEQRAKVSREFAQKLAEIDRQRKELLAITHQAQA